MTDTVQPGQGLTADTNRVDYITNSLLQRLDELLAENKDTSILDMFMVGHSFHKVVVTRVALQWARGEIPIEKTFKMAEITWHKAMRELWRMALTASE